MRVLQSAISRPAVGSERTTYYLGMPRAITTNPWYKSTNLTQPSPVTGATLSLANVRTAAEGAYLRRRGDTSAAPCYQTVPITEGFSFPPVNQPFGVPFTRGAELWIFREAIQVVSSAALPNGHRLAHGFSIVGNLLAGFPIAGAGSYRGISLVQRTSGGITDYAVLVKNANPGQFIPVNGVDLSQRTLVEHRLYAPKAGEPLRYELWINGGFKLEVQSSNVNWPVPLVAADSWFPMPMAMDNPGGGVTVDMRMWWSEIIVGPDSEGTY